MDALSLRFLDDYGTTCLNYLDLTIFTALHIACEEFSASGDTRELLGIIFPSCPVVKFVLENLDSLRQVVGPMVMNRYMYSRADLRCFCSPSRSWWCSKRLRQDSRLREVLGVVEVQRVCSCCCLTWLSFCSRCGVPCERC